MFIMEEYRILKMHKRGNGITDEGVRYLLPLIAGESYPAYENGLPVFLSLR